MTNQSTRATRFKGPETLRGFGQLGDTSGHLVPPQVTSVARKPLSIAFEEIAADKIEAVDIDPEALAAEAQAAADAANA